MRAKIKVIEDYDKHIDELYEKNGYQPIYMIGPGGVKTVLTKKTRKKLLQEISAAYDRRMHAKKSTD